MCPMNCHPTLCGMLVDVEDGRLLGVHGDPDNPDSQGFLCIRGQASREIIGNDARLLHPLVRERRGTDGWRRATWDEALDLVATRMQRAGAPAVGTWCGHGLFANNYGTRVASQLLRRFANLWGCQWWNPTMICWGLGGFGLGLTGILEVNTKEDMGAHAALIVLWGANLASQPNTARHLTAARRRGAHVVTIDVRETEAAAQSDETLLVRPGTDAALALAMLHVIVAEGLVDRAFVARHTVGFEPLAAHLEAHTPQWAAAAMVILSIVAVTHFTQLGGLGNEHPMQPDERKTRNVLQSKPALQVLYPTAGTTLDSRQLTFRWTEVPGSDYYDVRIVSESGDVVSEQRVTGTEWRPTEQLALRPGAEYFVHVDAYPSKAKTVSSDHVPFSVSDRP